MATGIGNLPYVMTPVSPFDVITSQAQNERIANIESLATGAGIGDAAVTSAKIDFTTFRKSYLNTLSSTSIGTGGGTVGGSTRTFTAPFDGMCILRGSVPLRANSTATTDLTARFRLNGSDISGANTTTISGRVISTGQSASMSDSSPYARFRITQGTSYTVTLFAQASVNGSAAADGTGWYETELVSTELMNTMI